MKWSGRFSETLDERVFRYNASLPFDHRLLPYDVEASLAHAAMLQKIGILTDEEYSAICQGLKDIRQDYLEGRFLLDPEAEDVHFAIEKALVAHIGAVGKKIHTARSRNDQVATDLRLYLRAMIDQMDKQLFAFQKALLDQAKAHIHTIMPGFTHLQIAQPISFAHHLLAYFEMVKRDRARLADCRKRVNHSPLGAAALAGTTYSIDREWVAKALGFEGVCENSLDAVSDRDFAVEFLACAALIAMHLSRLAEELILWSCPLFGFIALADRFCTGSSIMPQKKNPDVPELMRGKSGRVFGALFALLTVLKAQPLAYNKDNQEDKEPLFDTIDTLTATLGILPDMIATMQVFPEKMAKTVALGFPTATELADYLVHKGVPLRDAHEVVAKLVHYCENKSLSLEDLTLEELKSFHPWIEKDVYGILSLEKSLARRAHLGATGPVAVEQAIERASLYLELQHASTP